MNEQSSKKIMPVIRCILDKLVLETKVVEDDMAPEYPPDEYEPDMKCVLGYLN